MLTLKEKGKLNSGQSLLEVLVALSLVSLVIFGVVKTTLYSVSNQSYSQKQTKAVELAQKKIAEIIELKNTDPTVFFASLPSYPDETEDGFCLKVAITDITGEILPGSPASAKMANIFIDVYFGEKPGGFSCGEEEYQHKYNLQTNITN